MQCISVGLQAGGSPPTVLEARLPRFLERLRSVPYKIEPARPGHFDGFDVRSPFVNRGFSAPPRRLACVQQTRARLHQISHDLSLSLSLSLSLAHCRRTGRRLRVVRLHLLVMRLYIPSQMAGWTVAHLFCMKGRKHICNKSEHFS